MLRSGVSDAVEALLNGFGELAAHGQYRIHAQRMRHAATSAGRRHGRQIGKDGHQHVVVVGRRRLVGEAERPRQLRADADHRRRPQDAVDARPLPALERNLGVGVGQRRVALAHPRHPRHQILGRRRVGGGPLHRQEVAELQRREPVHVVDAERVALLRLDEHARRRQEVAREQVEIVDVPHTDGRDQVLVRGQALGAARSRHVEDIRSGDGRR